MGARLRDAFAGLETENRLWAPVLSASETDPEHRGRRAEAPTPALAPGQYSRAADGVTARCRSGVV
ncbi:hypothetical protein RKD23_000267 [Streptomyces sp. SAI-170]